jgi:hypothetical protein
MDDLNYLVGVPGVLSFSHHPATRLYEVHCAEVGDMKPSWAHRRYRQEGAEQAQAEAMPAQEEALWEMLSSFEAYVRRWGFSPVTDAVEGSLRLANMQMVALSVSERLGDIEARKEEIACAALSGFEEKKFTSDERRRQARDKEMLQSDSAEYSVLHEEALALKKIRALLQVICDHLDRQFRLRRYDYELKTVGRRDSVVSGGASA